MEDFQKFMKEKEGSFKLDLKTVGKIIAVKENLEKEVQKEEEKINHIQSCNEKVVQLENSETLKTVEELKVVRESLEKEVQNVRKENNHSQSYNDNVVQERSSSNNQEDDKMINQPIEGKYDSRKNDILCSEIKSTFIKRIDIVHYIKWLHRSNEEEEKIKYMRTKLDEFNLIMQLRMTLHRSNLDIIGLCKNWDKFDVQDLPIITGTIEMKFNMKEKGQMLYFWNTLWMIGKGILDVEEKEVFMNPNNGEHIIAWKNFSDKKKILHMMSILFITKVEKRLMMIGRDNKMELKMNRDYWEQFNIHWRSYIKTAYMINWNWNEFMKKEQVGIQGLLVQLEIIRKENWEEMKD
jgi:hypothetical protein